MGDCYLKEAVVYLALVPGSRAPVLGQIGGERFPRALLLLYYIILPIRATLTTARLELLRVTCY